MNIEYKDAVEVIDRVRQQNLSIDNLTVWVSERHSFADLMLGADEQLIPLAQVLWYELLELMIEDKPALIKAGQILINRFCGIGTILDVTFDVHEHAFVWKVQYPVV